MGLLSPVRRVPVLTATFLPLKLSGLQFWCAADRITPTPVDGDQISPWLDLSGNARDLSQVTAAKRPTYRVRIVNGRPVARADNVDDDMATAAFSPAIAQPTTVFIVGNFTAAAGADELFFDGTGQQAGWRSPAGNSSSWAGTTLTGTAAPTAFHVMVDEFNGASSAIYVNGAQDASGNAGTNSLDIARICSDTVSFLGGDIAEVGFYNRILSVAERGRLTRYLGRKYGIAVD